MKTNTRVYKVGDSWECATEVDGVGVTVVYYTEPTDLQVERQLEELIKACKYSDNPFGLTYNVDKGIFEGV